jgi:DtxR family Mn-dependent transcriptional regulator
VPVKVTEPMEEYLETIYRVELEGEVAKTGQISKHLGVTPQTVTDMIQKLEKAELVEYEPYKGVNLTDAGRHIAKAQLERHRVMQAFLQLACGMEHRSAHDAACAMEHTIPPALDAWIQNWLENHMGKPFDADQKVREQIPNP